MEVTTAERYASGGPGTEPPARNLYEAFLATVERLGDDPAIVAPDDYSISWNDLRSRVDAIAGGLAGLGVGKGDTVAIMLNNRPEFIPCDLGAVALGAVPFSIYPTSSPEQIAYAVGDAGARVAIVETAFLEQFEAARKDLPQLEHLIVVDGDGGSATLEEIETADPGFDPGPIAPRSSALDDLLTLIYTSGTTGPPKGVQLTHRNLMSLTTSVDAIVPFPETGGKVISWLPAAHIAERGAHYYLPVVGGLTVHVCPDPRKIVEFLPQVKPTWFFAVPRIFEKLKAGLEANFAKLPDEQRRERRRVRGGAVEGARRAGRGGGAGRRRRRAEKADEELFSNLRAALGLDEAVAVNVGAAPTPLEVLEFFHAIGIPIGELWGMSETCGTATCNPPERIKLGTVGPPVPGVEIKLAEDGEVLVRGDSVMPGYRNMPERNAETIDEEAGWRPATSASSTATAT